MLEKRLHQSQKKVNHKLQNHPIHKYFQQHHLINPKCHHPHAHSLQQQKNISSSSFINCKFKHNAFDHKNVELEASSKSFSTHSPFVSFIPSAESISGVYLVS